MKCRECGAQMRAVELGIFHPYWRCDACGHEEPKAVNGIEQVLEELKKADPGDSEADIFLIRELLNDELKERDARVRTETKTCRACGGCLELAFFDDRPENFYGEAFDPSYCPYCGVRVR